MIIAVLLKTFKLPNLRISKEIKIILKITIDTEF